MDMPNITMMDDPVDIENMFETYDYAHRWVQQKIEASTLFKQVFLSVKDARWLKNEMEGIYHNVLTLKESVTHMDQYGRMQRALARLVDQTKDMYVTGPPNESCVEFKYFYQVTELDENAETNFCRYQVQPGHHEAYDQSDNPELQVQDSMT